MKNNQLLKTNALVSIILIIGFALTAVFSYRANYQASLDNIEQVSSLTTEGIYYQLTTMFTKPVSVSMTMAHDSLLVQHLLEEADHLEDDAYIQATRNYLKTYQEKYGYHSVFLVSTATGRYYNFDGVDRVLDRDNPENEWYYRLLDSDEEYFLNVDNDEVEGADNEITVFVNCKINDAQGEILGIVGVGIRLNYLVEMLEEYEDQFGIRASLVSDDGAIQISTSYTGYEKKDWFQVYGQEANRERILSWKEDMSSLELWSLTRPGSNEQSYIVTRYIPELSWHLIVDQNTGGLITELKIRLYQTAFLIMMVIVVVLVIITTVIRNFNEQITELMEERQGVFKKATEHMYDNIYELNLTKNCCVGKRTDEYFESLGAKGLPYDEGLRVVAEKQIKEEFRQGYIDTFTPENVIHQYELGNDHLRYDFMIAQNGDGYHWMRIDAHIFYSVEDDSLHMFTYRKNIDTEKQREIQASTDEMTMLLTKKATERLINRTLQEKPGRTYAFFIFDIDNFKQVNDQFGHMFGDFCIKEFTGIIKNHFRKGDILGRIGGDEFAAFVQSPQEEWVEEKARELSEALNTVCTNGNCSWRMSASIGVSVTGDGCTDFNSLYRNADAALYQTKEKGKNGYTIFRKL